MYEVKLDKFSGPLEKLLELIEEKKLEITTVNLASVTGDFLDYLKTLGENSRHPSVLADFIVIASRLLLIKSKAILPSLELTQEEEGDIRDLEMRLKIYKEFKNAAIFLDKIWKRRAVAYGRELFTNLPSVFYPSKNLTLETLEEKILEIIQELKSLAPEQGNIRRVVMTVEHKIKELLERFKEQTEQSFHSLAKGKPKLEVITLFLAILHLLRDRVITTKQNEHFSDIIVAKP